MRVEPAKAWLVASREYLDNVRTRGFWVSLLLMPVLLLVMVVAPVLLADVQSAARYAVYDQSGWVQRAVAIQIAHDDASVLIEALETLTAEERPSALADLPSLPTPESRSQLAAATAERFVELLSQGTPAHAPAAPEDRPAKPEDRIARWWHDDPDAAVRIAPALSTARYQYIATPGLERTELNDRLADDSLLGYFVIPDDPVVDGRDATYVTRKLTNLEVRIWYARLVTNVVRDRRIREENIASSTADWIQTPITFETTRLTDSGTETAAQLGDTLTQWAPVAFVYLLWISIFSVTQMLLTNTVEEKSNKLVEVLLSSLRPIDLMAGKILGIAATGITIVG
jgi:ABC-2 type transport system permease protein